MKKSEGIIFLSLENVEQKVNDEPIPKEEVSSFKKSSFYTKVAQMWVKVGLDPEKVSIGTITPFDIALTSSQRKALQQGNHVPRRTKGLGYHEAEGKFLVNMTTT